MNKIYLFLIYLSLVIGVIPNGYSIDELNSYYKYRVTYEDGLPDESIIDMRLMLNGNVAVGTSGGLGLIVDGDYESFLDQNLPDGGNPAIEIYTENNESVFVVSGVKTVGDLDSDGVVDPAGTGISWSLDSGDTWNFIDQPTDSLPNCENLGCEEPLNPDNCECYPALTGCSWNNTTEVCSAGANILFEWNNTSLFSLAQLTKVKNVTYDLSVDFNNKYIYAASWGGMLRRFKYIDDNPSWEIVPLPMDNMSTMGCSNEPYPSNYVYSPIDPPIGSDNHKPFSVLVDSYNDSTYIWVGTANGINKGVLNESGCIEWEHFDVDNGLAGNWVIDIVTEDIGNEKPRIWLITWVIPGPNEHGLTYSDDYGVTWNTVNQFSEQYVDNNNNDYYDTGDTFIDCDINTNKCEGEFGWASSMGNGIYDGAIIYNLYFNDDILYATSNRGLFWSSSENIQEWTKINIPDSMLENLDFLYDQQSSPQTIYSCISKQSDFIIGTRNGLFVLKDVNDNSPNLWNVDNWSSYEPSYQNFEKLNIYPNPYNFFDRVTFEYKTNLTGEITIYDFAMNKVDSFDCDQFDGYTGNLKCRWDGNNINGTRVANGVYFCQLKVDNAEVWEKVMVINPSKGDY